MAIRQASLAALIVLLSFNLNAQTYVIDDFESKNKPLYELGMGAGTFFGPHYPGAEQSKYRSLVLPFFLYRGKHLKADEDGVRGEFKKDPNYRFDMSLSAGFPSDAEENDARSGMNDLDWVGEFGPRVVVYLKKKDEDGRVDLSVPVRAVFSTDFGSLKGRGYVFHPTVTYRRESFLFEKLNWVVRVGTIFFTEETADYFYQVDPQYVTAERRYYDAKAGYHESHIDFAWSYEVNNDWVIFFGVQNNFYNGATNEASPLLKKNETQSVALGFAWTFHRSEQKSGDWY